MYSAHEIITRDSDVLGGELRFFAGLVFRFKPSSTI